MFKRLFARYMEQADAGGAPGGAAADGAGADAGAADAGAAAVGDKSLLATGAEAGEKPADFIPEKLRVMKEDGSLDMDASSRKLAEAYGNLEKRFGAGDAPPKEVGEYKVAVPDALKEVFDPAKDEGLQGFLADAHKAGLNQAQLDLVMGKYFDLAPKLAAGAVQLDAKAATEELKKTWATEADFNRNVRNAFNGASAIAQKAGIDINEVMNGPLGNSPQFLRLMAAIGPEFQEDRAPGAATMVSGDDITKLMASEAYTNPKHVDHAKVSAQIKTYFERKHGTEAAA